MRPCGQPPPSVDPSLDPNPTRTASLAHPTLRRALEGCEKVLGAQHPDTLSALKNLAGLLQARGQLEEAEPRFRWGREQIEARWGVHVGVDGVMEMGGWVGSGRCPAAGG